MARTQQGTDFVIGHPQSGMTLGADVADARRQLKDAPAPPKAAVIDLTEVRDMPDGVDVNGPPQGFVMPGAPKRRQVAQPVEQGNIPGQVELDPIEENRQLAKEASEMAADAQPVAVPTSKVKYKPTTVLFAVPGGRFRVKYEVVIIGDNGNCLILKNRTDNDSLVSFEPDMSTSMLVVVGDADAKTEYNVISCGMTYLDDGWSVLILPIVPSEGDEQ